MGNNYFVKFIKYEEGPRGNTLEYLRNQTIKFARPYELNDCFEMRYIHPGLKDGDEIEPLLNKHLEDPELRQTLLAELPKLMYVKSFIDKLIDDIQNHRALGASQKKAVLELIAYEYVGIFCFSDILVLLDNSLSVMFAHYGDELNGLALIYEINNPACRKVSYLQTNKTPPSGGIGSRISEWRDGNYDQFSDFIHKSDKWAYEAEYRLLGRPGVHNASDYGVSLKAILHTKRLGRNKEAGVKIRQKLDGINHDYYENGLKIVEVGPSYSKFEFQLADDSEQYLEEWVKENFLDLYSPEDWRLTNNLDSEGFYQCHLRKFYEYETEQLKEDILSLRQFISQGKVNEQVFFGMTDGIADNCFFNVRKLPKPNAKSESEVILMIDDFFIHDQRKWAIAEYLFDILKKYANGIPVYVQNHGESEMTKRFLQKQNGIRILEIYKI